MVHGHALGSPPRPVSAPARCIGLGHHRGGIVPQRWVFLHQPGDLIARLHHDPRQLPALLLRLIGPCLWMFENDARRCGFPRPGCSWPGSRTPRRRSPNRFYWSRAGAGHPPAVRPMPRYHPRTDRSSVHRRPADNAPRRADVLDRTLDCRDRATSDYIADMSPGFAAQNDMFGQLPEPDPEASAGPRPLADRLRPSTLDEVVGQDHLLGPDGPLGRMVAARLAPSLILWGPPGGGKTTIARLLAARAGLHSSSCRRCSPASPTSSAPSTRRHGGGGHGQGTLLFVDEIHRFNRAQQDGFLPFVEDGTITLIGATTENPSFELNGALLSRCQVWCCAGSTMRRWNAARPRRGRTRPRAAARSPRRARAARDGRRRRPLCAQHGRAALGPAGRDAGMDPTALAALLARARRALRQGPRGALQPDLRAAQVDARLRSGRGALLARPHAGRRRGSALHRPPPGALRGRGHRHGRPATR